MIYDLLAIVVVRRFPVFNSSLRVMKNGRTSKLLNTAWMAYTAYRTRSWNYPRTAIAPIGALNILSAKIPPNSAH